MINIPANSVPTLYFHDDPRGSTGDCRTCEYAGRDGEHQTCEALLQFDECRAECRAERAIDRWVAGGEVGRCPVYSHAVEVEMTWADLWTMHAILRRSMEPERSCLWADGTLFIVGVADVQ